MNCFHCAEPVPADSEFRDDSGGETRVFCCAGCLAVTQTIFDSGLGSYYQFRQAPASRQDATVPPELLAALEQSARDSACLQQTADDSRVVLFVEGLNCPACSWLVERHLRQLPGVHDVQVQLAARRMVLRWDHQQQRLRDLLTCLLEIGYRATPFAPDQVEQQLEQESRDLLKRLAVAGFGMMQAMMYAVGLYLGALADLDGRHEIWLRWSAMIVSLPVLLYSCWPFTRSAINALKWRSLNMDVPVALAMWLAFAASAWNTLNRSGQVYFESLSMFAFLLLLGRFLELKARQRATRAAGLQQRLLPATVQRWCDNRWQPVALSDVAIGDRLLVKAGETVPADGVVLAGGAGADESLLSGEPALVAKCVGDSVLAGSLLHGGALELSVQRSGSATFIAQLTHLQDDALAQRPPLQLTADRVARGFILAVLMLAVLVYGAWRLIDADRAFDITLSVLVITCPCALSLALPTAWAAATHQLLRDGVLLRRAAVLEKLATLTDVVFDKTGTLTTGQLRVVGVQAREAFSRQRVLAIAAALERHSTHPIAHAFLQHADAVVHAGEVNEVAGLGVSGLINGQQFWLGQRQWLQESARALVPAGDIGLADASGWLASFQLQDELRPDAVLLCQRLRELQLRLHVISGDHEAAVQQCAQQLGIVQVYARQSPADKCKRVKALQQQGSRVLMLGDGINDAPVLATADVSIAVGNSTDFARRAADAVLLQRQLQPIAAAIVLARNTRRIVRDNLAWALIYNTLALPAAVTGMLTPWQAAIGMSLSSLLVTVNSLRLLRRQPAPALTTNITPLIERTV